MRVENVRCVVSNELPIQVPLGFWLIVQEEEGYVGSLIPVGFHTILCMIPSVDCNLGEDRDGQLSEQAHKKM